ncbi:MAG: hypothetical protein ACOC8H_00820 [bacterium]
MKVVRPEHYATNLCPAYQMTLDRLTFMLEERSNTDDPERRGTLADIFEYRSILRRKAAEMEAK